MTEAKESAREYAVQTFDTFLNGSKQRGKLNNVVKQISDHAYGKGYDEGLNDAWECAKKLILLKEDGGVPTVKFEKTFGTNEYQIFKTMSAAEALKKMKECEEESDIKIGDEVIDPNGLKAVVTNTDTHYHLLYESGKTWKAPKSLELEKTGVHFERVWAMEEEDNRLFF